MKKTICIMLALTLMAIAAYADDGKKCYLSEEDLEELEEYDDDYRYYLTEDCDLIRADENGRRSDDDRCTSYEYQCSDDKDNDCDRKADYADSDCRDDRYRNYRYTYRDSDDYDFYVTQSDGRGYLYSNRYSSSDYDYRYSDSYSDYRYSYNSKNYYGMSGRPYFYPKSAITNTGSLDYDSLYRYYQDNRNSNVAAAANTAPSSAIIEIKVV